MNTPTGITIEYDPLFGELSSNRQLRELQVYAREVGETSITNLYHLIYVVIILSGIVFLIEKIKKINLNLRKSEDKLAGDNQYNGVFQKWYESLGFSKTTVCRYINYH
jgi:hypothetical protein